MKKIFLIIVLCSLNIFAIRAQKPTIVYSAEKLPQRDGTAKLKILKNGNTASIELMEDVGIVYKLYDTNRKKISEVATPLNEKLSKSRLRSVVTINNEIMVMLLIYPKGVPTLVRYLYDGTTGKQKSENVILEMPVLTGDSRYHLSDTRYVLSDYKIVKDPFSDYYAVVLCDIFAKDPAKQIEVVHYSPKHEIISRSYLTFPENKYKYLYACDVYVDAGESVILSAYGCNTTKKYGEDATYYLAQLKAGKTAFANKILAQTKSSQLTDDDAICKLLYDNKNKELRAVISILEGSATNGHFLRKSINPKTLDFNKSNQVTAIKASDYYKKNILEGKEYAGTLQNYIVDQKGNDFYLAQPASRVSDVVWMFDIAATCSSPDGQEIYGRALPYSNMRISQTGPMNYMDAPRGQFIFLNADEFNGTYIDLIPGKENNYILLNNLPEKFDRPENVRSTGVHLAGKNHDDLTSFIYTFNSKGELTKEYLFGKPGSVKDTKYALLHTADYDSETGLYATQVVQFVNGKKVVSIAWISLK
jgi:hypothetical protein